MIARKAFWEKAHNIAHTRVAAMLTPEERKQNSKLEFVYEKPTNWTLIGDETGHRCQMNWMRVPEALDSAASIHFPDLAV
ncbi:hypothetical protein AB8807_06720 [Xanthomonas campestris pv. olitorii]|nr:hypothetical protein KWH09_06710 [Xanthomonas campestris pv. olitorii]